MPNRSQPPTDDPAVLLQEQRLLLASLKFCCLSELPPEPQVAAKSIQPNHKVSPELPARKSVPPAAQDLRQTSVEFAHSNPIAQFPHLSLEQRRERLAAVAQKAAGCEACRLHLGRTNSVPGEGNPMAELMFVGEGPGQSEDEQGRPFVGRSGELLTKIIEAMTFSRDEVFIGNVVKCRPPENRKPHADEMETCLPYLAEQIEIIQPKVLVTLGVTALTGLLPEHLKTPIGKIRGQWLSYRGIPVMPTLHPAFLLRQPTQKRVVWEDMQLVMAKFGRKSVKP